MAFVSRQIANTTPKDTRTLYFGEVRGVDFRSDDTASYRTPESVNMYRSRLGLWETHVGHRQIGYVGEHIPIWGVHKFTYKDSYNDIKTKVLVHAGTKMYLWDNYPEEFTSDTLTEIFDGMAQRRSKFVEFDEELLILDGEALYYFDGEVFDFVEHQAYVPQTQKGKPPSVRGDGNDYQHEQRNFLTPWVIEGFTSDGTSTRYILSMNDIDEAFKGNPDVWIVVNGVEYHYIMSSLKDWKAHPEDYIEEAVWDDETQTYTTFKKYFATAREKGAIVFKSAPEAAEIAGVENLFVRYSKSTSGYPDRINKCTEIMVFDNRVFVTGHPEFPNVVFWSGDSNFTYWGELNYNDKAGSSSASITALQRIQENRFISIKQDTHQDGAYTVWSPYSLNNDYISETYVTSAGASTKGCLTPFTHKVFLDDNVFLSTNGLNAISRNLAVSMERNVEHRSTLVDSRLLAENLEDAIMEEHRGYLYILFPNGHCYMANSAMKNSDVSNNVEYEWAYLERICGYNEKTFSTPTQLKSFNDKELYLCCENGRMYKFYFDKEGADGTYPVYTYNFDGHAIGDYVDSPNSWFGVQNRFKKLIRKYNDLYCVVNSHAQLEVLFHTEKKFMDASKVLPYKADVFAFNDVDFSDYINKSGELDSDFTFKTLPPVSFVLRKLKGKKFRRLQIRVRSAGANKPIIFKSLVVDAYILTKKLK